MKNIFKKINHDGHDGQLRTPISCHDLKSGQILFDLFGLLKDSMASVDYTFVYLFIIALMQLFSNVYTLCKMLNGDHVNVFTYLLFCGLYLKRVNAKIALRGEHLRA